jgi:putative isomerase
MLVNTNVPLRGAWNTWSERPAEMVFLPLGVRVTPVLYSSRLRKATTIRPPHEIRFGRHDLHGEAIDFETSFGDTRLSFAYAKRDPFCMTGSWSVREPGEWGLRYWVTLCLSAENAADVIWSADHGAATVAIGDRVVALVARDAPVQVTGHDSVEAVVADFDAKGYFDRSSRADHAKVLALRFNLEMTCTTRFAAAVADSMPLAMDMARAALDDTPVEPRPVHEGRNAGALDAVRDVIGWNTLYDRQNARTYTSISRIWNIGDFAVWFNDQTFAALMAGVMDAAAGRDNMAVAMASATPQGNFACLLTSRDAWVDRSQAPHGAFMAWMMYLRSRDRALLELVYEPLRCNHRWWRASRDPHGRGLVSCGTSDVGDALYKGTAFGARNETGMDNSATHDEAVYDPLTRTLSTFDLGLNCALALDAEMLAAIAAELGHADEAQHFSTLAEETRARISSELWDDERGVFANRHRDGGFVRSLGPTSIYPLLCGAATPEQIERLLVHLDDPSMFGGEFVLPNAARSDPAYKDNVYWRGRIWANVNYLVWQGLRRCGLDDAADSLAAKSLAMFERQWAQDRLCGENYNAETGEVVDQGDADPFYTWGAMLPLMGVSQVMDFTPWFGWQVVNTGEPARLGPMCSPAGTAVVTVEGGWLTLSCAEVEIFSTDHVGALRHIIVERGLLSVTFAETPREGTSFRLGASLSRRLIAVRLDGETSPRAEGSALDLAGIAAGTRLDVHLSPA